MANNNSYSDYNSELYEDIATRKEFALYTDINQDKPKTILDKYISNENKIILNSYQSFIKNFINQNTKYNKLFVIHGVGLGKTISSLSSVNEFIKVYKTTKLGINNIIIIGFTQNIFKRELLLYPEFGFLTLEEIEEFKNVENKVNLYENIDDIKYYNELKIKYTKRLSNRNLGGIFKFYGYKELFNNLLDFSVLIKENFNLNSLNEKQILEFIKLEKIKINYNIMNIFSHSLIICDEIHNTYNSFDINNWGITIQLINDYYNDITKKNNDLNYNSVRIMYLSATPISNNIYELVSMINLLNDKENRVTINDLFNTTNNTLLKNKIPLIKSLLYGKISYAVDNNPEQYPTSGFMGENIKNISYLKFIKCTMSKLHQNTYIHLSQEQSINHNIIFNNSSTENIEGVDIMKNLKLYPINLSLHNRYLNDYVLPNPNNDKLGVYLSKDNETIYNASIDWKDKNNLSIDINKLNHYTITGNILLETNLKHYSAKYYKLLQLIKDIVLHKHGKIFIYHHFVNNSGVAFIQSILQMNGMLFMDEQPINSSLCSKCYNTLQSHNKNTKHEFNAIRFMMVTGDISKSQIYKNLNKFNSVNNINGDYIKIILGSKAIRESYNLKGIQHIMITHSPDNISELIQIIGRAIRKNSHIDLPSSQRHTSIYVLVSSIDNKLNHLSKYPYSFEEARYKAKINIYKQIQELENIFFNISVDYLINFNINKRKEPKLIGDNFKQNYELYDKYINNIYNQNLLNTNTFNTYYIDEEIDIIKSIIKRIFIEVQNVLNYNDLLKLVKDPPFQIYTNTKLLSESSFILALDSLIYKNDNIIKIIKNKKSTSIINSIYNNSEQIIVGLDYKEYIINNYNEYFVLTPYNVTTNTDILFRQNYNYEKSININLNSYLAEAENIINYDLIYESFKNDYNTNNTIFSDHINNYSFSFNKYLVELIIENICNYVFHNNFKKITKDDIKYYILLLEEYTKLNFIIYYEDITTDYKSNYASFIKQSLVKDKFIDLLQDKNKISKSILPLGHLLTNKPYMYNMKSNWSYPNIYKYVNYKNNIDIFGYNYKEPNSTKIIFKLNIKSNNIGIVCQFKDKTDIIDICKLLNIPIPIKTKKIMLCEKIKNKLLELEKKERVKNSNIKYFYEFYENF